MTPLAAFQAFLNSLQGPEGAVGPQGPPGPPGPPNTGTATGVPAIGVPTIVAGASGAIMVSTTPQDVLIDIETNVVPTLQAANAWTGSNDFSKSSFLAIPGTALPTPTVIGQIYFADPYLYIWTGSVWRKFTGI